MVEQALYWIIGVGPYFATAIVLGLLIALASPWLIKHPDRWLFFALIGFNLMPLTGGDPNGSTFKQLTWGSLFVIGAFHALRNENGRVSSPLKLIPVPLAILILYALFSASWSPAPLVSVKRAAELIGVLIVAIAIMRRMPPEQDVLDLLPAPAGVFLLFGLLLAIIAPSIAFDSDHALKAMTSQKNTWGQFSLLAAIVFVVAVLRGGRRLWLKALLLILCIISLFASRSMTSIISFFTLLGIALTWLLTARARAAGWLLIAFVTCAALMAFLGYTIVNGQMPFPHLLELFFEITGKSPTLTGRTFLWQLMLDQIRLHPWLGIGYGGFWINNGDAAKMVIMHLNWGPPDQAHNGYIDVVNEIGIVGMGLLLLVFARHIANLATIYRLGYRRLATFHAALMFSALEINYAESSFIRTTDFWWVLLSVSIVSTHVRLLRLRQTITMGSASNDIPNRVYGEGKCA